MSEETARTLRQPMSWKPISIRPLFIFFAVAFLEFCHAIVLGFPHYLVYPVLDMSTHDVSRLVGDYISPWFFWSTFPFVIVGVGVGLAMGSRITSKGWKVALGYTILAVTLVGVGLYITLHSLAYNWIYQLVTQNIVAGISKYSTPMFIQSTIGNSTVFSRCFWTAFQFVVAGVVVGFIGSQIKGKI